MTDSESKAIWKALAELHDHHVRQIDEKRKSARRMDELEVLITKFGQDLNKLYSKVVGKSNISE